MNTIFTDSNTKFDRVGGRQVAVDSKGYIYSVFQDAAVVKCFRSIDGGTTWTDLNMPTVPGATSGDYMRPTIAIDGTDNIHIVWATKRTGLSQNISYTKYTGTWSARKDITSEATNTQKNPMIAVDSWGYIHIVWEGPVSGYSQLFWTRSKDGGSTFATNTQITNVSGYYQSSPTIALDVSNNLHIAYIGQDATHTTDSLFYLKMTVDGSQNYTIGATISLYYVSGHNQFAPFICIDKNNVIAIAWISTDATYTTGIIRFVKNNGSWQATVSVTTEQYSFGAPTISIDVLGKYHVFFQGQDATNGIYTDIWKRDSADGGITWTGSTGNGTGGWLYGATSTPLNFADGCSSALNTYGGKLQVVFNHTTATTSDAAIETVTVDTAPTAPTNLTISNFDATDAKDATFTFNDADAGDSPTAYELVITKVSDGSIVLDTGKVSSTIAKHTIPANTLINEVQYQAKVCMWDKSDVVSPYSTLITFWTSAKPVLTVNNPASDGATCPVSNLTVQWTTPDQGAYQVKLLDSTGTSILSDSGKVSGSTKSYLIPYALVNNTNYRLQIQTWDNYDIPSLVTNWTIVVSYTSPAQPAASLISAVDNITVNINNPTPQGTQPVTTYNELYRRKQGETGFIRIATSLAVNGQYKDYTVASGQIYEYKIRAQGANQTSTDSMLQSLSISFICVYLHNPTNPEGTCHGFLLSPANKGCTNQKELTLMQYAGRVKRVAQFGIATVRDITFTLNLLDSSPADETALTSLIDTCNTLCYRDNRGRKMFGVIGTGPLVDNPTGKDATLKIEETDYSEVV